jgi:hypothetical protein
MIKVVDTTGSLDDCISFVRDIYEEYYEEIGIFDNPIFQKHDINLFDPILSTIYKLVDGEGGIIGLMEVLKCSLLSNEVMDTLIKDLNSCIDIPNTVNNFRNKYCDGTATYINKLYIKKEERNKGYGKKFINLLKGKIYLDVYVKNKAMMNYLTKFNAKQLGQIWNEYSDSVMFYEFDL